MHNFFGSRSAHVNNLGSVFRDIDICVYTECWVISLCLFVATALVTVVYFQKLVKMTFFTSGNPGGREL